MNDVSKAQEFKAVCVYGSVIKGIIAALLALLISVIIPKMLADMLTEPTSIRSFVALFGVEVDLTMGGVCAAGKAAFSEGDFNAYSGNVQNIFSGSDFLIELDSVVKAKVQVGAGLCGVLSARGYVSIQMKLQLVKDNVSGDPYGIILNAAGGLGFDLVLLKVNRHFQMIHLEVSFLCFQV